MQARAAPYDFSFSTSNSARFDLPLYQDKEPDTQALENVQKFVLSNFALKIGRLNYKLPECDIKELED